MIMTTIMISMSVKPARSAERVLIERWDEMFMLSKNSSFGLPKTEHRRRWKVSVQTLDQS
jgi:hypothetical protein